MRGETRGGEGREREGEDYVGWFMQQEPRRYIKNSKTSLLSQGDSVAVICIVSGLLVSYDLCQLELCFTPTCYLSVSMFVAVSAPVSVSASTSVSARVPVSGHVSLRYFAHGTATDSVFDSLCVPLAFTIEASSTLQCTRCDSDVSLPGSIPNSRMVC